MKRLLERLALGLLLGSLLGAPAWGEEDAAKLVKQLYEDKDAGNRYLAAEGLLKSHPAEARRILKTETKRRDVLELLLSRLEKAPPGPSFFDELFGLYKRMQADERIRARVTSALRRQPKVHETLARIAGEEVQPDASRASAIRALGELRAWRQMGALLDVYRGKDKAKLGKAVQNALRQMTRLDYGADLAAWQKLWAEIKGRTTEEAVYVFLDRLHQLRRRDIQVDTQEALKLIDARDLKQNLVALQSRLPGVREAAVKNLSAIGGKEVGEAFLKLLELEKQTAVLAALLAGASRLPEEVRSGPALLALAERVRTANNPHPYSLAEQRLLYARLADALGQVRHGPGVALLERFLAWPQADEGLKLASITALGRIGAKGPAYAPLARILSARKESARLLKEAAEALSGFPEAVGILVGALDSPHAEVRAAVAISLDKVGARLSDAGQRKLAAEALIGRLSDARLREKDARVRNLVISALGNMQYPAARAALASALVTDGDSLCRLTAAEALLKLGKSPESTEALLRAMEDKEDAQLRAAAFKGLQVLLAGDPLREKLAAEWFAAGKHAAQALAFSEELLKETGPETPQNKPRRIELQQRIARCLYRLGRHDDAAPLYAALLAKIKDPQVIYESAELLARGKQPAQQQQALQRLAQIPAPAQADQTLHWRAALLRTRLAGATGDPRPMLDSLAALRKIGKGEMGGLAAQFDALERELRARVKQKKPGKTDGQPPKKKKDQPGGAGKQAAGGKQGK